MKKQKIISGLPLMGVAAHKIGRRVLYNDDEVVAAIQSCAVKRYQHESIRLYIFNK